ncbi:MAG: radical SAM protein [Halobacteriota archaeon]
MKESQRKKDVVVLFKGNPYKNTKNREKLRVPLIPLSLISLASPLKEAGYTIKIVDQSRSVEEHFSDLGDIWQRVICVGLSALTGSEISEGIDFVSLIKKKDPTIPVVWGGWHVSILPEQSIKHRCVDIIVKGLGQKTFLDLVKCIDSGRSLDSVKNLYYKDGNKTVFTGIDCDLKLEDYPLLAFGMLDLEDYRKNSLFLRLKEVIRDLEITGHLYYVSSFGCPNDCAYCCSRAVFGRKIYKYNIEKVVEQIKWLVNEKKFNSISFMDANFFIDIHRVKTLCELLVKEKIKFVWDAQMHVKDIIRYEKKGLWKLMTKSGCWRVNIGSESGSQEILDYIRKHIKIDEIFQSAQILSKYKVEAAYNFLFALPLVEDKKHIYESFKLAEKLKRINPEFSLPISFYVPFPGTTMYNDALSRGLKPPDSLEEWGQFDTNYDVASEVYPWKFLKREKLIMDVLTFYIPLAIPGNMYRGTIRQINDKMQNSKIKSFIKMAHCLAKLGVKYSFYHIPFEIMIFKLYRFLKGSPAYLPGG